MNAVSDLHVASNTPLATPAQMLGEIARNEVQAAFVAKSRRQISEIVFGADSRLLLVVGPCSIHDTRAGMEYATRLRELAGQVGDKIYLVMRAYFEKPRTTVGWKGLIMDPHLDGTGDISEGLRQARGFLRELVDLGLPTATELLDPITPQYIADFICWSADWRTHHGIPDPPANGLGPLHAAGLQKFHHGGSWAGCERGFGRNSAPNVPRH